MTIPRLSDDEILALFTRLGECNAPLLMELSAPQTLILITMIQLACRHPEGREAQATKEAERIARGMQDALDSLVPGVGAAIEQGWHPEFDVRRDPAGPPG
jgi:hypothetical protein